MKTRRLLSSLQKWLLPPLKYFTQIVNMHREDSPLSVINLPFQ